MSTNGTMESPGWVDTLRGWGGRVRMALDTKNPYTKKNPAPIPSSQVPVTGSPPPKSPDDVPDPPLPPARPAIGTAEYLAGGPRGTGYVNTYHALAGSFDDATLEFGPLLYEVMLNDPTVNSCFLTLKQGILDKDFEFTPAIQPDPEETRQAEGYVADPTKDADAKLAKEICDFCSRMVASMRRPLFDIAFEMLDAMAFGNKLAEKVYKLCEDGPDKGKIVYDRIKVKPRHVWGFVVDSKANVLGIVGVVPGGTLTDPGDLALSGMILGATQFLPREKFAILTWLPRNEDPRGTSVLRQAYASWNYKLRTLPQYSDFNDRMAGGFLWGTPAEGAPMQDREDEHGNPIQGPQLDPSQAMLQQLTRCRNSTALVTPPGSTVSIIYPQNGGENYVQFLNWLEHEIVFAIHQTTRATLESEFGSRADSETSQEEKGLVTRVGKRVICRMVRDDLLRDAVRFNWGDDAADRLTPNVAIGETEHHAFSAEATAIAALTKAGYLDKSQLDGIDQRLGLPKRRPVQGDDASVVGTSTVVGQPKPDSAEDINPSKRPPKPSKGTAS